MSLESVSVCANVSVSMYNINYLTLHFPGKMFWLRHLLLTYYYQFHINTDINTDEVFLFV